ncbi:unnamed protein product, partial [marine sediment metagenome]
NWWYRKTVKVTNGTWDKYKYYSFYIEKGRSCMITVTTGEVQLYFKRHEDADASKRPFWS